MPFVINDVAASTTITWTTYGQTFLMTDNAVRRTANLSQETSRLINYGTIFNDVGGSGAVLSDESSVDNMAGGTIVGTHGVTIQSSYPTFVNNFGLISGGSATNNFGINILSGTTDRVNIVNGGAIYGTDIAINVVVAAGVTVSVTNSGILDAKNHGIYMNVAGGYLTFNNSGKSPEIYTLATATVTNTGTIDGDVWCGGTNTNDKVTNNGLIAGDVQLGSGNDTYQGSGRVGGYVFGSSGRDTLTGGAYADHLEGGSDNDIITGGLGKDLLEGGTGNDLFKFTARTHSKVGSQADVITDFDDFGYTGDRIDVSLLFGPKMKYIHAEKFSAPGQVRINDISGPDVIVEVNLVGKTGADFAIRLTDTTLASMNAGDFIL